MNEIPSPSRKRLVTLSQLLSQIENDRVTSVELSRLTGWSEATIRRDISLLHLHSGKSNGYSKEELKNSICEKLNISDSNSACCRFCIVGLGRLGSALLETSVYPDSNFQLAAGFDSSTNRTEILKSSVDLYSTAELESVIKSKKIEYALLAVPDAKAQSAAEKLVSCGIKGIVNYTGTVLSLPESVSVENVNTLTVLRSMVGNG